ncbi:hypothetical protein [Geopseudomonas aromaticivorans]
MSIRTHQGFTTTLAYNEADDLYFGRIEGISELIRFVGDTPEAATAAFIAAVDDYLADGGQPAESSRSVLIDMDDQTFETFMDELEELPLAERKLRLQQLADRKGAAAGKA